MLQTIIITQARVNSSRLPNKIFLEANSKPFIGYHLQRIAKIDASIIVATTNNGSEQPILDFCAANDVQSFRGSETNVLERFYDCATQAKADVIIRVTSDCPLIDGDIIAKGLKQYQSLNDKNVYYSNVINRTYPRGMDYEIFSFKLLEDAFKNATTDSDKEHVTPYIWNNRSGTVKIVDDTKEPDHSNFRITLDTVEDFQLLKTLIENHNAHELSCAQIENILESHQDLTALNAAVEQKKV